MLDPFLNELTDMYKRNTEKGSVWVTLKRSSMKSKAARNKIKNVDELEHCCLVRATDGKKTISTMLSCHPKGSATIPVFICFGAQSSYEGIKEERKEGQEESC
ncbi:putative signal recognition particle, SRP14 subunit, signal recognition particle, SRP9/SRP14 subunit [Dioscorea sansibarensis]